MKKSFFVIFVFISFCSQSDTAENIIIETDLPVIVETIDEEITTTSVDII